MNSYTDVNRLKAIKQWFMVAGAHITMNKNLWSNVVFISRVTSRLFPATDVKSTKLSSVLAGWSVEIISHANITSFFKQT